MYIIEKTFEISAAHKLNLSYKSMCNELHGHNWKITVHCASEKLNSDGMVFDFKIIKDLVSKRLDHAYLNDNLGQYINPTAENLAKYICDYLGETCIQVDVWESEGNKATYIRDIK